MTNYIFAKIASVEKGVGMAGVSWVTTALVAAIITLVLSRKLLSSISFSARSRRNGCKKPARYPHMDPVLGLDYFMILLKERKEGTSLAGQRDRFARLGHTYEVNSWGTRTIQTMDQQNIREVLITSFDKFGVQQMRLSVGMPFIGPGVFSTDGPYWEHSRKLIQPIFSHSQISDFKAFDVHLNRMLKRLPRDGSTIELQSLLKFMYLDHSTKMIFGKSTEILLQETLDESSSELLETYSAAISRLGLRIVLGRLWIFNVWDKTYEALTRRVHAVVDIYIDEAIERRQQQQKLSDGTGRNRYVIVDELVRSCDNREEIRDQLLNIFLPARDAAAVGLSACLFHLARHPDVWNKLRAQVLSIQGPLTRQALLSLPYMQAVLNESLRLNSPAAGNRRQCTEDCILPTGGGPDGKSPVFLSKGDGIEVVMGAMHYDPEVWGADAEEFRPERWLEEGNAEKHSSFYMPFSIGKRICPGKGLTLTENAYVIARLMQNFKSLENRDPVMEFVEMSKLTTESRNGVLVGLIPEDAS